MLALAIGGEKVKKFTTYYNFSTIDLEIVGEEDQIHSISFMNPESKKNVFDQQGKEQTTVIRKCIQQLEEYFSGTRKVFTVPYKLNGTEFQKRVWVELEKISYGETISYLELAKRLGDEKVIRAAVSANGKNKLGIVIPCHRVIGANGSLTGYAGGLENKKKLLELEKRNSTIQDGLFG